MRKIKHKPMNDYLRQLEVIRERRLHEAGYNAIRHYEVPVIKGSFYSQRFTFKEERL